MSVQLLFNQRAIPRTTTRQEWREIDRWRRSTQRITAEHTRDMSDAIGHLVAFGQVAVAIDVTERLINPPVIGCPEEMFK